MLFFFLCSLLVAGNYNCLEIVENSLDKLQIGGQICMYSPFVEVIKDYNFNFIYITYIIINVILKFT